MEQSVLHAFEKRCIQEEMPRCRAVCPLHVDVRAFMERMAGGDAAGARKALERHMPLPGLLALLCEHPCEDVCLRRDLGGSLAVGELERVCAVLPRQTKPLPVPAKARRVAVIGDSFAGLTVAWDLGRKGWPVTVFHADETPGRAIVRDAVRDNGDADALAAALADETDALRRARVEFARRDLGPECLAEARAGFDAVFVDAAATELALCREALDPVTLAEPGQGDLCFGGWAAGPVGRAAEGRRAAGTLERFLTGVSLTASREAGDRVASRLQTPLDGVEPLPRREVRNADDAPAEAARCLRCECMACVKECAYLAHHQGYPKTYARQIYNNASIVKGQHLANALINGCSLCGQCEAICPEQFSMADLCLAARREMVERGYMPPSAHEFALDDMAAANGPDSALFLPEPGNDRAAHLFFPGCQLAASRPEQVLAVYGHLRAGLRGGVGLALRCCGVPARWAGREDIFGAALAEFRSAWEGMGRPRVVAACASCLKTLRDALPGLPVVSLWQVLAEECAEGLGAGAPPPPEALTVHDPCAARHDRAWQGAVRHLVARSGARPVEPPFSGELTACCGYGGLAWNARPVEASAMAAHRAGQLEGTAVASCVMCRDRLAATGKPCLHVLDVLFSGGLCDADAARPGPTLSARRTARAALKRRALADIWRQTVEEPAPASPRVFLEPDVLQTLEERRILLSDVALALREAEAGRAPVFLDKSTGRALTSWRPSRVTFWVLYSPENGGYRVHDAYSHRMVVPGTGNVDGAAASFADDSFRPAAERGGR